MKKLILTLMLVFGFSMMIPNTLLAQFDRVAVNTDEVDLYEANNNLEAVESTTGNPDDGYPSVFKIKPGTKVPTIGEIKDDIVKYIESTGKTIKREKISNVSYYTNTPYLGESCYYTYWIKSKKEVGYNLIINYKLYLSPYWDTNEERKQVRSKRYVNRKTGEALASN